MDRLIESANPFGCDSFATWVWIGIILMVYPMFITKAWLVWATGSALCGFAYYRKP